MSALRVVVARGDPLERGRTLGYELADLIRHSLEFYWRYLVRRGVHAGELAGLLSPYLQAAERELPDLVELVSGMAAQPDGLTTHRQLKLHKQPHRVKSQAQGMLV